MKMRAAKRGATSDLNHDNWNQEEEAEDPGIYEQAPADVISRRKIRVARRRGVASEDAGTGGLFKSFTGFTGSTGLAGAAVPTFNFGAASSDKVSGGDSAAKRPFGFGGSKEKADEPAAKVSVFQFGAASSSAVPSFSFATRAEPSKAAVGNVQTKTSAINETAKEDLSTRDRHLHLLRSLNLSVNKWISSHVEKDPYCDLTPVFADYEKHLREIERKYPYDASDVNETVVEAKPKDDQPPQKRQPEINSSGLHPAAESTPANGKDGGPPKAPFSFLTAHVSTTPTGKASLIKPPTVAANFGLSSAQLTAVSKDNEESAEEEEVEEEEKEKEEKEEEEKGKAKKSEEAKENPSTGLSFGAAKPFSFGFDSLQKSKPAEDEPEKPAPTLFSGMNFKFGSNATSTLTSSPFSFGLGGSTGPSPFATAASAEKEEEELYEPPKPEVKEIKEEGAVLTKRCKLFYKSDEAWQDKGVGNLHLKPIEQGKLQAIIRADTNLGTILLNVMLTKIIPITRQKNNLTLLCVPSPPMKPVKAGEEAPKVPIPLLVRFKTEADCEEVLREVESLREEKK